MSADDSHLGLRIAPLVDGELSHTDRERALAHLIGCEACRVEADEHRRLKQTLANLTAPRADAGRAGRLMDMARLEAAAQQRAPDAPAVGGSPRPAAVFTAPPGTRTDARREPTGPATHRRVRRRSRWMAGGGSVLVAGFTAVLALGAPPANPAVVDPGQARFLVEHVATSNEVPFSSPPVGAAVTATYRR